MDGSESFEQELLGGEIEPIGPAAYNLAPNQGRIERTPEEELAFWRKPGEQGTRRDVLLHYVALNLERLSMKEIEAFRVELRVATDLEVLIQHPQMAPLIVALRDGAFAHLLGTNWGPIPLHGQMPRPAATSQKR